MTVEDLEWDTDAEECEKEYEKIERDNLPITIFSKLYDEFTDYLRETDSNLMLNADCVSLFQMFNTKIIFDE